MKNTTTSPWFALFPRLMGAFFQRDYLTQLSYRTAFALSFFGLFFRAFVFFFISRFIGDAANDGLAAYNADYFAFVLIGLALNPYFDVGLTAFARALRQAQTTGTLEAMIMTPTPVSYLVIGSAVWSYAFTTFQVFVYLILGAMLGVNFANANWLTAIVGLLLAIIAFASIGIMAASIIMVIKRGDPVTAVIANVSALVGGVYYPLETLPNWLQTIAQFVPLTHALQVLRLSLLNGATIRELRDDLLILLLFCLILLPLALFSFRYAVDKARQDGSLAQY